MSGVAGATIAVVRAGYEGKLPAYERMAELGVRIVLLDERGHWSQGLGLAERWLEIAVTGDPDADAAEVLRALDAAGVRPDGVLTILEDSTGVVARVAQALGLPGNPPAAVDAARSKVRTRELSAELGLPTPKARRVRSLDELYAAAAYVGFPAVVKPEFGAAAMGTVRVDDLESLPSIYSLVRDVARPEGHAIFRAGNDLLLEEYLDGVEFDVDLVMHDGECVFSSVSQNWPTAEPSFQETGLHCPADHNKREVRRLVDFVVDDGPGVRAAPRRPARGGQVHLARAAHRRGQRAARRRPHLAVRARGLGRGSRRGARPGGARAPAGGEAEPEAAARHRRHDRPRAGQRPARRAPVRGGGDARRRARDRGRGRGRGGDRGRAGGDLRNGTGRGLRDREGRQARA